MYTIFAEDRPLQVVLVGETTQENEEVRTALKVRLSSSLGIPVRSQIHHSTE